MSTLLLPTHVPPRPQSIRRGSLTSGPARLGGPASLLATPPAAGSNAFPLSHAEKLSVRQAARRLGVTLSTVYRLIETEVLEASKVGGRWVIYATSVESLLDRMKNTNA